VATEITNLSGSQNDVWGVVNKINKMAAEGEIQEILVIWKKRDGGMLHSYSDLSSLLFLGMMKLVVDEISELKREKEETKEVVG